MTQEKFTKGPWFGYTDKVCSDDGDEIICFVNDSKNGLQDGNANLIAASPLMYNELIRLRASLIYLANHESTKLQAGKIYEILMDDDNQLDKLLSQANGKI